MKDNLALINGQIVDINDPLISMVDRGYNFGDGVYEVTPFYNGKCFTLIPHMERLFYSLKELQIPAVYTMEELIEFHERLIAESGYSEGSIYLQVTRGAAPRTHYFPEQVVPCLTMHIREGHSAETQAKQKAGVIAVTVPDIRWLRCDIKSLNLLGNVMAKQRAKEQGAFEAIFYRDNGNITEGSSSNLMVVKDGIIWTHPANNLILNGITRRVILERLCQDLGISFVEKAFDKEFIKTVDEAFVTATTIGAMPIVKLDKDAIGNGKVGEVTQKLQAAYEDFIQKECFGKK